ncbi:MAG: GNAT family N-acetyltransferase [Gemmatimonadales bacterium]
MHLHSPALEHLDSYTDALRRGWSPDNLRPEAAVEELRRVEADPEAYIRQQVDRAAQGPPIVLPDGSHATRLPSLTLWMWDGAFCGAVGLRWQPGTADLPPTCLGHAGFSVVPWKRRRGYATKALGLLLPIARAEGLPHVELTTDPTNLASRRVIHSNGGTLVERFTKPAALGGGEALRFRILLALTLMCVLPAIAPAQAEWLGRAPTAGDTMPATIAEAEAEAARHPRATANNVMETATGVTIAKCRRRRRP